MNTALKIAEVFGITTQEARVYVALSKGGAMLVQRIAKETQVPRTVVYTVLHTLEKQGLVSRTYIGKRTYYCPLPVEHLPTLYEQRKYILNGIVQELQQGNTLHSSESQLEATLYSGAQGIQSAGLVFLNETKEKVWYSFENLARVTDFVGFDFEEAYIAERVARHITSKMILSCEAIGAEKQSLLANDTKKLRETVSISPRVYPFHTTVVATKGLLLLINPNENPFALLIRNADIAQTHIALHTCIWERYRQ